MATQLPESPLSTTTPENPFIADSENVSSTNHLHDNDAPPSSILANSHKNPFVTEEEHEELANRAVELEVNKSSLGSSSANLRKFPWDPILLPPPAMEEEEDDLPLTSVELRGPSERHIDGGMKSPVAPVAVRHIAVELRELN